MFRKKFFSLAIAAMALVGSLSMPANAAEVFVRIAPPRPIVEHVLARPAAGYVWVGGFYRWTGRSYIWVAGRWALPPRPGAVWVAPHWEFIAGRHGYVFAGGFWR